MKTTIRRANRPDSINRTVELERLYEASLKIKPLDLERFGYRLTARYIMAGGNYKVFELLPLNSAHAAEVSFLTHDIRSHGVIIPDPFQELKARLKA